MSTIVVCDMDDCHNMDINYDKKIFYISDRARKELNEEHCCQDCWEQYIENDFPSLKISEDGSSIIHESEE